MSSLRGQLLIAEPRLPDSNFFRSVVLVIEHTDQGASGLILNRPGSVSLSDVWEKVSETPLARNDMIFSGGPVEGPLTVLHRRNDQSDQELISGVYMAFKRQHLDVLLGTAEGEIRVFSGYAGWGPGQLENEMKVGGWLVCSARPEHVFSDAADLYKRVCDELGSQILFGDVPPRNRPPDPMLN